MTGRRKQTQQLKKLRQIFEDTITHSELLEQDAIRTEVDKGLNIITEMEKDNEDRRRGDSGKL